MEIFIENYVGDITDKIIEEEEKYTFEKEKIQEVINSLDNHTYWQTPPLYLIIKIQGKKLYKYARQGKKNRYFTSPSYN